MQWPRGEVPTFNQKRATDSIKMNDKKPSSDIPTEKQSQDKKFASKERPEIDGSDSVR